MVKRKIFTIGDLVRYIGQGTEEYKKNRTAGIVLDTVRGMIKVKWCGNNTYPAGIWYQPRALEHLEKQ